MGGLLWAVPVVAALVAAVVLVSCARAIELGVVGLVLQALRLRELRPPLHGVRRSLAAVDEGLSTLRERHASDPDARWP